MWAYICVGVGICICMCIFGVYVYVCIRICRCIRTCLYSYMYLYVEAHMYVYASAKGAAGRQDSRRCRSSAHLGPRHRPPCVIRVVCHITFESTRDTSGSPPAVAFGVVVRWRSHIQVAFEKPNGLLVEGRSSVKDA